MSFKGKRRKRTLYGETVSIFMLVIIIILVVSSIMMYFLLDDFMINEKIQQLSITINQIDQFSSAIMNIYKDDKSGDATKFLKRVISEYSSNTNTLVMITDTDGQVLISLPSIEADNYFSKNERLLDENIANKLRSTTGYYLPDERQYKSALQSDLIQVDKGDFYGLYSDTDDNFWLTLSKRLTVDSEDGNEYIIGAVIISSPAPLIYLGRTSVIKYFLASLGLAASFAFLLVSFFTAKITRPLKALKNKAVRVSKGDFTAVNLEVDSKDEIGELVESFNNMVTDLKNLDTVRSDFISNVSHELRTPMTSIKGFVESILDGTVPPDKEKYYLEIVRDELTKMNNLVNNFLDMTRMEQNGYKINCISFNINEMLRMNIIKFEKFFEDKKLEVEVDFENDTEMVFADRDSIERVIINLLHNAIKFTPEKGTITIATKKEKDIVKVSISDTGVGIPEEEQKFIWDRFYKSDKSRSMDKSGTGLGLAICKNIINSHKQEIYVETNKAGVGSTFTFTLKSI